MRSLALCLILLLPSFAVIAEDTEYSLTIYSRSQPGAVDPGLYRPESGRTRGRVPGYAVVRQITDIELQEAVSDIRVDNVAALIDPTTVDFTSLSHPESRVLEQSFEFDLVSSDKLLERYLDRPIEVSTQGVETPGTITGTLLSTEGGVVLREEGGGVRIIRDYQEIGLPDLPGGLITRPTLVWKVATDNPGVHRTRISYQTEGLTWWSDYNLLLTESSQSCKLDLSAWVSIVNQSGAGFPDSRLKLIAGDVQRLEPAPQQVMMEARAQMDTEAGFQQKSFFEYHLYTLQRPTSLPNQSTKQLELFPTAQGVPCSKTFVYDGGRMNWVSAARPFLEPSPGRRQQGKVSVFLSFENLETGSLGIPLPAGRIRVNQEDDADGSIEFIGEDVIDHTPKGESVRIRMGSAFDLIGERKQTDFEVDTKARVMRESVEVRLRNHKQEAVEIQVHESLYRWTQWSIDANSHDFEKLDARTIRFPVTIAADAEAVVAYSVEYRW